jgi:hypothetical protein
VPRRSVRRFLLEVLFLVGVAAALVVADLRAAAVIALMALAWVVVALLEWTAWLDEPHYGRGLPPRYYVPQVALPPLQPVPQGYSYPPPRREPLPPPRAVLEPDDAPTFVASTTEWAAELGEWPVLDPTLASEETMIMTPEELDQDPVPVVPLPPVLSLEETVEHVVVFPDEGVAEEDEETEEPEPVRDPEPERERGHEVEIAAAAAVVAGRHAAAVEHAAPPARRPPGRLQPGGRVDAMTSHRVDPLEVSVRRRLFRRSRDEASIEILDGPPPGRTIPARVLDQSKAARR